MRVRRIVVVGLMTLAGMLGISRLASACVVCDVSFQCVAQPIGAKLCVQNSYSCAMAIPCGGVGGFDKFPDAPEEGVTAFSLFDAEGASPRALKREAGSLAFGEHARTIAGFPAHAGALTDVSLAFGSEFAVSLVNDTGDGFALRRTPSGGRVELEVRDVVNGVPGRVLASETLGPRDVLAVPVTVAGRARVLLIQTERVAGPAGHPEIARLRRALAEAGRALPVPATPLFRPIPQ